MWNFFVALVNIIPWDKVYNKLRTLLDIPTFLMYGVVFATLTGLGYIGYQWYEYKNNDDIRELKTVVDSLRDKVDSKVQGDDYRDDFKLVLAYLQLMEKMQQFQYEEMQIYMDILCQHVGTRDKTDPLIRSIDVAKQRNRTEYNLLKSRLDDVMERLRCDK